jgi:peptidoglycan/LPS O-acetylase OafA/YrhL
LISLICAGKLFGWSGPIASTYCNVALVPFLTGVWLASAATAGLLQKFPAYVGFAMMGLSAVGGVLLYNTPFESVDLWPNSALMVGVATFAVAGLLQIEIKQTLPQFPALVMIGDSSYSLYLTHIFVVGGAWFALRHLVNIEVLPVRIVAWLVIVVAAIAIGRLFYLTVEQPLMSWSHRISKSKKPVLAPLAA